MNEYKIRIIKKYEFTLNNKSNEPLDKQVSVILNENNMLDLPYLRKTVKVKIKKMKVVQNNEKSK